MNGMYTQEVFLIMLHGIPGMEIEPSGIIQNEKKDYFDCNFITTYTFC